MVAKILNLSSAPIVVLLSLPLRLVGIVPADAKTSLPSSVPNAEARNPKQQLGIALADARTFLPSFAPNAETRSQKQQLGFARNVEIRTSRQNSALSVGTRGRDNCEHEIR